jgi:hypothetical protein
MHEWRAAHPKATLRQMEQELDHRWVLVRARMLAGMAVAGCRGHSRRLVAGRHDAPNRPRSQCAMLDEQVSGREQRRRQAFGADVIQALPDLRNQ